MKTRERPFADEVAAREGQCAAAAAAFAAAFVVFHPQAAAAAAVEASFVRLSASAFGDAAEL